MKKNYNILSITPISHISGIKKKLSSIGCLHHFNDPLLSDIQDLLPKINIVFTNPNKSKIFIGEDFINRCQNLIVICTASTGINHIDINYAKKKNIKIISLTNKIKTTNKISSTAEHALALTLASVRNIVQANRSVEKGFWDYTKFIGRQINHLNVGVVGYGRLGKKYSHYLNALGSNVFFYDPYAKKRNLKYTKIQKFSNLLKKSDIISFHVHISNETQHMLNKININYLKKNVIIINTSRGDIIDELSLVKFLRKNNKAKYATDVIENEILKRKKSPIINFHKKNKNQVIITPHIGGMTIEAQYIAYTESVNNLKKFIDKIK